jgi:hypothetical protein
LLEQEFRRLFTGLKEMKNSANSETFFIRAECSTWNNRIMAKELLYPPAFKANPNLQAEGGERSESTSLGSEAYSLFPEGLRKRREYDYLQAE